MNRLKVITISVLMGFSLAILLPGYSWALGYYGVHHGSFGHHGGHHSFHSGFGHHGGHHGFRHHGFGHHGLHNGLGKHGRHGLHNGFGRQGHHGLLHNYGHCELHHDLVYHVQDDYEYNDTEPYVFEYGYGKQYKPGSNAYVFEYEKSKGDTPELYAKK